MSTGGGMRPVRTLLFALFVFIANAHAQQWESLGNVSSFQNGPDGITVIAERGRVGISVLSPSVVRVRYTLQKQFADRPSFAVLPSAFAREHPKWQVQNSDAEISLSTGALTVRIYKSPLRISFVKGDGTVISEDLPNSPASFNGTEFKVWKTMPEDEHYFGLGDKTGPMDHRNLAFTMWNTDIFGWQESTDPLYKDIPFIFAFRNGASYAVFLDNTYRSSFDFGKERSDAYSFGAEGGDLDYYFINGPEPKRVVEQFTQLVGRTPLPPLFALGYQQCRYSYYPESQVQIG